MEELAIKIEHVSKQYRLGAIGGGTLKGDLQSWWARKRGREDPNSRIGDRTDVKIGEKFLALDDVNLEVKKGEALGIIGHNGAGKSTLLKLLSRVTAPTAGKISYNGRITSMLEVGTGFHPELTGRENIYMNGAILGLTKAEIDAKMEQIIDFSEVRQFIDTPVKRYSSGMYVKLAFSVAAHLDSEIMIMDEVLAVGDMAFQKKCLDKMREAANKEGRTVLYVSHNMNTIRQLCDRCIVLDKGKIVFDGDVEEAIEVYMGNRAHQTSDIDLTTGERTQKGVVDGVKLTSIRIVDHDKWEIHYGEKLRFEITAVATADVADVSYRSRLFTEDGMSVTSLYAPHLFSCKAGETVKVQLEADLRQLVPGRYCLTPVLYAANEYGGWQYFDHIEAGVTFEVKTVENFNNNVPWSHRWSGAIKLQDMVCIDCKHV